MKNFIIAAVAFQVFIALVGLTVVLGVENGFLSFEPRTYTYYTYTNGNVTEHYDSNLYYHGVGKGLMSGAALSLGLMTLIGLAWALPALAVRLLRSKLSKHPSLTS